MSKKAYVLNPHDDDGVIAVGGTLIQLIDNGWEIGYIQFTDGRYGYDEEIIKNITSEKIERIIGIRKAPEEITPKDIKKARAREAEEERKFLGIKDFLNFNIEDGKLERYKDDNSIIEEVAKKIKKSDIVFIPNRAEGHPDHRAAYEIGSKALNLLNADEKPLEVHYLVWVFPLYNHNPGNFEKVLKVDIDNQMERKLKAIRLHESQVEWGRYDKMVKHINAYFSLIYSAYRKRERNYSEVIGIPGIISKKKFNLFVNSLENFEDVTQIFHGRKSERIKARSRKILD